MPTRRRQIALHARARELRSRPTPAEARVWELLRLRRCDGARFRRQHVLAGFIVDFYCPALRLVIELEGAIHDDAERRNYDDLRQRELEQRGCRVVRIRNEKATAVELQAIVLEARRGRET
jgi:very-short-patch-repair endonuclease